jgi:hypothetical protein
MQCSAVLANLRLLWFPCTYVQKVRYNLAILQVRTCLYGFVGGTWFRDAFQNKTRIKKEVQPLTDGSRKPWCLESPQAFPHFWRRSAENPFRDFPLQVAKVVADSSA